jgi:DNA polymerase-3 subunit gamma/tau
VRDQAGLAVDEESVQAAVRRGRGSARDALSALDQVVASGTSDAARPELSSVLRAVGQGAVADVLVNLSTLLARGWGPQQMATELVDDLRQVFLAVLAPELCAVSGPDRGEFAALAESMGLARVVRSMEILGRALVDMRDAPDAQVVLEIAIVRATRPDLDSGIEALTERVSALERALASGAAPGRAVGPSEAAPPAPRRTTEVAPPASAPPAADLGRRPSVGAVLRRQQAAPGPAPAGVGAAADVVAPAAPPAPPTASEDGGPRTTVAPVIDRDSLTQAWGDFVLGNLPARIKAVFSAGRFVAADENGAQFALPNAAHRDRCAESAAEVEAALAAHFGTKVSLVLVVDGDGDGAARRPESPVPTGPPPSPPASGVDELEVEDPADLVPASGDDTDHLSAAEARLLEAFPGTSEVAE